MTKSVVEESFLVDIEILWKKITTLDQQNWRSDCDAIEVVDEVTFIERSKGYETQFHIIEKRPYSYYAFSMENENMSGMWCGHFQEEGDVVKVSFEENVTAKKWWMKPFVKMYLKKHQKNYIRDLQKE